MNYFPGQFTVTRKCEKAFAGLRLLSYDLNAMRAGASRFSPLGYAIWKCGCPDSIVWDLLTASLGNGIESIAF
jgi:hypothetical protein